MCTYERLYHTEMINHFAKEHEKEISNFVQRLNNETEDLVKNQMIKALFQNVASSSNVTMETQQWRQPRESGKKETNYLLLLFEVVLPLCIRAAHSGLH